MTHIVILMDSAGGQSVNETAQSVSWNNPLIVQDGFTFSDATPDQITVSDAATYQVLYNLQATSDNLEAEFMVNDVADAAGNASATGTPSTIYHTFQVTLPASAVIKLDFLRTGGTTGTTNPGAMIYIEKL